MGPSGRDRRRAALAAAVISLIASVLAGCGGSRDRSATPDASSAQTADSPDAATPSPPTERTLEFSRGGGSTLTVSYCGNGDIAEASPRVRTVVLVIHGDGRNSCDYATSVMDAAATAGELATTLVVAPRFIKASDPEARDGDAAYWSDEGWKQGDASLTEPLPRPWTLSSFEVADRLVAEATAPGRFPALRRLTLAGHSAGGQFVNRYAATTARPPDPPGLEVAYVVANPSSYLYLTPERPSDGALAEPTLRVRRRCPGYDRYKYGLAEPNPYAAASTAEAIRARYDASHVTYLLGEDDTAADSNLDESCSARLQGKHRLARGQAYYATLGDVLGAGVYVRQRLSLVPGVGHDGEAMLTSPQGRAALFA